MARKLVLSGGELLPESVAEAEGLSCVAWPGGLLEVELTLPRRDIECFTLAGRPCLLARGAGKDLGACFSLILGVLTTQTYAQAILLGKSDKPENSLIYHKECDKHYRPKKHCLSPVISECKQHKCLQ